MTTERNRHYRDRDRGFDLIAPEPRPRSKLPQVARAIDVSDAEFIIVDAPAPRPAAPGAGARAAESVSGLSAAIGRAALSLLERLLGNLSSEAFVALTITVGISAFWLFGGFSAFDRGSDTAEAAIAGTALSIIHTDSHVIRENGLETLVVDGIVSNDGPQAMLIPAIDVSLAGASEPAARIASPGGALPPGQSAVFSVRIKHPGGKVPRLDLSFATPPSIAE